ncbi:hypothetical protein FIBSPDRAFT_1025395 [Athelia psychrophila]|uniref:F-box domain-containing protein n=1 Tax=Athelia psychrophila TaxID=1759441 RepID=A0A166HUJ2_9AGAM|nr:hypothetical protein FIBSPDRAFT_1025395 [Fibularhizoctonia sp. CBS 109695]
MSESSHLVSPSCGCDLTRPDIKIQETPFPHLLNLDSHHVLSAAQSDIVHNTISSAIRDVSQLDLEMSRLEAGLAEIRLKRDENQKYIIAHKALVSTIRRVPAEIIAEIFIQCLRGRPMISPHLAAICRRWRSIIFSSSRVCTTLSLVVKPWHLDSQTAWAKMCLSHSGEYPLSIDLRGSTSENGIRSLMEVLVARSEQWHTLHLSPLWGAIDCLDGAVNRLHRLENLSFGRDMPFIPKNIQAVFATAPRLCSLRLFAVRAGLIPQLPWKQLQVLKIGGIEAEDCLDIMEHTSNLIKCDIVTNRAPTRGTVFRPRVTTLPLVRSMSLQLTKDYNSTTASFLSTIYLPVIEDLHITCDVSETEITNGLLSLISDGTLVKLALKSPRTITAANMVAILRAAPTLQELSLKQNSASCLSSRFLERFNGPIASCLVPKLQKIEVDCYEELDVSVVEEMIKGRCLTNQQSALRQVVLKFRKKDHVETARLRQIRDDGLSSGLVIQILWQDNTPMDLDSF